MHIQAGRGYLCHLHAASGDIAQFTSNMYDSCEARKTVRFPYDRKECKPNEPFFFFALCKKATLHTHRSPGQTFVVFFSSATPCNPREMPRSKVK